MKGVFNSNQNNILLLISNDSISNIIPTIVLSNSKQVVQPNTVGGNNEYLHRPGNETITFSWRMEINFPPLIPCWKLPSAPIVHAKIVHLHPCGSSIVPQTRLFVISNCSNVRLYSEFSFYIYVINSSNMLRCNTYLHKHYQVYAVPVRHNQWFHVFYETRVLNSFYKPMGSNIL